MSERSAKINIKEVAFATYLEEGSKFGIYSEWNGREGNALPLDT